MTETGRIEPSGAAAPQPRRRRVATRPWAWSIVVLGMLGGIGYAVLGGQGAWRIGCLVVGGSLAVGAVIRLVVSPRTAGLLAVRGRVFDVVGLLIGAAVIMALALVVPGHR